MMHDSPPSSLPSFGTFEGITAAKVPIFFKETTMDYYYRERVEVDAVEREWGFKTGEELGDFLEEYGIRPESFNDDVQAADPDQYPDTPSTDPEPPADIGAELKEEIDRLRRDAMTRPMNHPPVPRPEILNEIRDENLDRILKEEFLRTPEDLQRIRDVVERRVGLEGYRLEDFTEKDALLILRPFGYGKKESTVLVVDCGIPMGDYVASFHPISAQKPGDQFLAKFYLEEIVNPDYLKPDPPEPSLQVD